MGYTMMPASRGSNHCLYLSETCHVILYVVTSTNNNNIPLASYWFEVEEWGEIMWLLFIAAKCEEKGEGRIEWNKDSDDQKVYHYHLKVRCGCRKFWYIIFKSDFILIFTWLGCQRELLFCQPNPYDQSNFYMARVFCFTPYTTKHTKRKYKCDTIYYA